MEALKLSYNENYDLAGNRVYGYLRVVAKDGVTTEQSSNYSPFGAPMNGRNYNSNSYKYGFNGKENDAETVGTGSGTQDYGFRIYNPSLGKFLSVDPLTKKYPELTPYQFASNRPIDGIDQDGLEYATFTIFVQYGKVTNILVTKDYELKNKSSKGPGIQYNTVILDKNGKVTDVDVKLVPNNIYGIYGGSENPRLPKKGGKSTDVDDDYSLDPIDEVDAAAKKHDLAYDDQELKGFDGIMSEKSGKANTEAANEAGDIMTRYKNANKKGTVAIDKVSKKPITMSEFKGAMSIYEGFKAAEAVKAAIKKPSNEEAAKQAEALNQEVQSGPK